MITVKLKCFSRDLNSHIKNQKQVAKKARIAGENLINQAGQQNENNFDHFNHFLFDSINNLSGGKQC